MRFIDLVVATSPYRIMPYPCFSLGGSDARMFFHKNSIKCIL